MEIEIEQLRRRGQQSAGERCGDWFHDNGSNLEIRREERRQILWRSFIVGQDLESVRLRALIQVVFSAAERRSAFSLG